MKTFILAATAALIALSTGCPPPEPPPPPPPEEDAGTPLSKVGEVCKSDTITNDCETGLECGGTSADGFTCVQPQNQGGACVLPTIAGPNPPADGCLSGFVCSVDSKCIAEGAVGAACTSSADCDSFICGTTQDGLAAVCVVNECVGTCGVGKECLQQGSCGQTCAPAAAAGEACFTPGTDVCSPKRLGCASGLECFEGDINTGVNCGAPGRDGDPCSSTTPDDGCIDGFTCSGGHCQEINP